MDDIDSKIGNAFNVKSDQLKSKSQNAMRATSRIPKVRSEKEMIDFNQRYGSLSNYVSHKKDIEKKLKNKKLNYNHELKTRKKQQEERNLMMNTRKDHIKKEWSARMKELNLGLSRKYDIGKEIEMEMKN